MCDKAARPELIGLLVPSRLPQLRLKPATNYCVCIHFAGLLSNRYSAQLKRALRTNRRNS
jgi:hypothetical protein